MSSLFKILERTFLSILGSCLYWLNIYEAGIKCFSRCLNITGSYLGHSYYHKRIGFGLVQLHKFEAAIYHFEQRLSANNNDLETLFYLGGCFAQIALTIPKGAEDRNNLLLKAETYIEKSEPEFASWNWGYYVTLGILKKLLGKREEARACYLKALAIEPKAQMAKDRLAELEADAR